MIFLQFLLHRPAQIKQLLLMDDDFILLVPLNEHLLGKEVFKQVIQLFGRKGQYLS